MAFWNRLSYEVGGAVGSGVVITLAFKPWTLASTLALIAVLAYHAGRPYLLALINRVGVDRS